MSDPKRKQSLRPNLFVQIEENQQKNTSIKEDIPRNNVALKPLRSGKNAHQLKKFNFDHSSIDSVSEQRDLLRIHQLEQERSSLKHKIELLTAGAVSAIAEKEDQIQKLKVIDHINLEEKLEFYQAELERTKRAQQELEEEKEQLYREFQEERAQRLSVLEQKEELIEAMYEEMVDIRRSLECLQQSDLAKSRKIKLLQEENSKLSIELQELSLTCSITQIADRIDSEETIKKEPPSIISSIHSQPCLSLIESTDLIYLDGQQSQESQFSDKISQINKIHKEDIIELRNFYEKRIAALRGIYQKELNLPTEENQREECISHTSSLTKKPSKRSLKGRTNQHQEYGFNLNLKDMYAIEERAEEILETERTKMHDLKYEIKMQNLSQCPSIEPRLRTQENMDAESSNSHFTTKYFQPPMPRFLRKNKSSSTFNPEESKTVIKISHKPSIDEKYEDESVKNMQEDETFWTKTKIFAVGVLSGVTVSALSSLIFKKNGN